MRIPGLLTSFLIAAILISCAKSKQRKFSKEAGEIQNCQAAAGSDSAGIALQLRGTWTLLKIAGEKTVKKSDGNVKVSFNDNSTFAFFENSTKTVAGDWRIRRTSSGFEIVTDPAAWSLHGTIYVCDDQLLLSNSMLDGEDYLYVRAN
jgi:hypothetical protein